MQRKWYTMTCTGNFRNFGPDIAEIFGQCALKQEYVSCTLMLITSPNLVKCQIHIDKHWLFSFSSHSIIRAEIEMLIFWTGQGWAWKSSVDKIYFVQNLNGSSDDWSRDNDRYYMAKCTHCLPLRVSLSQYVQKIHIKLLQYTNMASFSNIDITFSKYNLNTYCLPVMPPSAWNS